MASCTSPMAHGHPHCQDHSSARDSQAAQTGNTLPAVWTRIGTCLQHFTSRGRESPSESESWQALCRSGPKPSIEIVDTAALPRFEFAKNARRRPNVATPPDARRWERCRCIRREVQGNGKRIPFCWCTHTHNYIYIHIHLCKFTSL